MDIARKLFILPKNIVQLAGVIDKKGRQWLNGIISNGKTVFASDGVIMAIRKIDAETNFPLHTLFQVSSTKIKGKHDLVVFEQDEPDSNKYNATAQDIQMTDKGESFETVDHFKKFLLDISRRLQGEDVKKVHITLDLKRLNILCESLSLDKKKAHISLTFDASQPTLPILVTTENGDCAGLISPMNTPKRNFNTELNRFAKLI